ncbi:MAG: LCP family protein, partial [Erysipelotrichaceae bacterium]|nr:LCP family protein [Erysipelotrichaceae bacterium]
MKRIKNKKIELISWVILLILAAVLYFVATDFFVFPARLKLPLLLGLIVIVCITGIIAILVKGKGRIFACILNGLLIVCMIVGLVFLSDLENRVKSIFVDQQSMSSVINVYELKENDVVFNDATFIIQRSIDQDNQNYALDQIKDEYGISIKVTGKSDVIEAAKALYENDGDLLVLNEVYVDLIEEIEGLEDFSERTKVVYSTERVIKSEAEIAVPVRTDITDTPFTVYVAGCDTRSGRLSIYGRTDVNLLLTVNPNTKQMLIVGIPRDTYIPNPALDNGLDKLTHLGNHGINNTIDGVSDYLDIDIDYYGEVIFDTFKRIIDAVGGIDVDNPYYFTSGNYSFDEGLIHLNGERALVYARTRKTLDNGDYGRNEHQTFVLKAFIRKVMSEALLENYNELLDALKGQFMTDIDVEDIFKLANMQLSDNKEWDIITYHLGGIGDMCGTASMGWDRKLYVVHLFDSQVGFVKKQMEMLKRDELIVQETLPQ